jgi:hypothetical protein
MRQLLDTQMLRYAPLAHTNGGSVQASLPSEGTRVVLLKDVGSLRAGDVGVVVKAMTRFGDTPTDEDVFIVVSGEQRVWVRRSDVTQAA